MDMITLILPGYSAKNKDWADEVAKNLKMGGIIRAVYWDHWRDENETFKPNEKADLIVGLVANDSANIVAKSVGTLVAAKAKVKIPGKINKLILCGIPSVSEERLEIFKKAFSNLSEKDLICFQNEGDPFVKPKELETFMNKVNPRIKVISMPRHDHHYPYFEEFNKFLG